MSLKIISTQIYEDYEEKNEEIHKEYNIKFLDKSILIKYNSSEIIFNKERNTLEVKREENNIFIELNKENESIYKTPYGEINIKTLGEKILIKEEPFNLRIEYLIKLGSMKEYKNIIEVLEANI